MQNALIILFFNIMSVVNYPKILRPKDLKKISKYPCDGEIKDAYIKYLTNYSFTGFVNYCMENCEKSIEENIFKFTDLQLENFKPNSLIWISHVLINFMIYFDVNLDYGQYYDAYASALQFTALYCAIEMLINKISFEEVQLSQHSKNSFKKLFDKKPDFNYNLKKDCELAYKSFNQDFDFTVDEFYQKVKSYFD